jgi:hypothetical protein
MVEVATKGISPLSGACDAKQLKLHIQVLLFYSFCTHTQPMQRSASMGQWSFFATMITFLPVRISCGVYLSSYIIPFTLQHSWMSTMPEKAALMTASSHLWLGTGSTYCSRIKGGFCRNGKLTNMLLLPDIPLKSMHSSLQKNSSTQIVGCTTLLERSMKVIRSMPFPPPPLIGLLFRLVP